MQRLRSVGLVLWIVSLIVCIPLFAPTAEGQPRTVRVATKNVPPFVSTNGDIKSGFTIDILDEVSKRAGWQISYVDVQTVTEQLGALTDGKADAAAAAISITADRMTKFDFSQPVMSGGPQIMVPMSANKPSSPGLVDFIKLLFSKTVLVWLVAAVALTFIPAHITWLLERRHPDSMVSKSYFPGVLQSFRWGIGSMAGMSDDSPRHSAARIMAVIWGFICIIFIAYYTATLTANITVGKFESQIKSASDLVGKRVCTVDKTTSAAALDQYGVAYQAVMTIDDCYKGLKADNFDAVVYDAPVLNYYASQLSPNTAQLVGSVLRPESYGIAFPLGSPLRKAADEALLRMREDGTYRQVVQKWFGADSGIPG